MLYTVHNPADDTRTTSTLAITGKVSPDVVLKAFSKSYQCIVVQDNTPSVSLHKFGTGNAAATLFKALVPDILADAGAITAAQTYQVAKDCGALVIKTAAAYFSYHWNAGTPAFEADVLPATIWVNP